MATSTITLKTDTTANWQSSNRILALNEPAIERVDDNYVNMKIGDGKTPWNSLGYVFKLKTLEDINTYVTEKYNAILEITNDYSDTIQNLIDTASTAASDANTAAAAAQNVVVNKVGIDDSASGSTVTYSSNKINNLLKVLATNRPKEWGVRFPLSSKSSTPTGERLGDAIGLTANVGTDTVSAYNDFDYLTPWRSRRVNGYYEGKNFIITAVEGEPNFAVDGSNGNVFAERNLFYYKYVFTDEYYEIWISDTHLDGYDIPDRFINIDKSVMNTYYYPCYKISLDASGNPVSISGANTMLSKSYSGYRTFITSKLGTEWHMETTKDRQLNELLYYVEFASKNTQAKMFGAANMRYNVATDKATVATTSENKFICSNSVASNYVVGQTICIGSSQNGSDKANNRIITSIETYDDDNKSIVFDGAAVSIAIGNFISSRCWFSGGSDGVLTPSGSAVSNTNGKYQQRYRYVEDLWGNQWSIMGDILIQDFQSYICDNPTNFADSVTTNYESVGYTNSSAEGWVKEMGWDAEHPTVRLPIAVGGASNTYFCDYYWKNSGLRVAYAGGTVSYGANAGLSSWNCDYAPSNSYWSIAARLSHTA